MRIEGWTPDLRTITNPVNRIVAARYTSAALVVLAAYDGVSGHFVQAAADMGVGAAGWKLAKRWEKNWEQSVIDEASSEKYQVSKLWEFMINSGMLVKTIRSYAAQEVKGGSLEDWRTKWQHHQTLIDHIQQSTGSETNILSNHWLKRIDRTQMQQYNSSIPDKSVQGYRIPNEYIWKHPLRSDVRPRYVATYSDSRSADVQIGVVSDNGEQNDYFIVTWRGYNDAMGDISYTHVREEKMVSASAQLSRQDRFLEIYEGGIVPTTCGLAAWEGYVNPRGEEYGLPKEWNKTEIAGADSFLTLFGKQRD